MMCVVAAATRGRTDQGRPAQGYTYDARLEHSRLACGQPNAERIAECHSSDHPVLIEKDGI